MRLRSIGDKYHVASFETASPEETNKVQVREFALRDSLTGLVSRRNFDEYLGKALAGSLKEPVAVLLVNLDRFKAVNDTLGHAAGGRSATPCS